MAKARRMKEKEQKRKSKRRNSKSLSNFFLLTIILIIIGIVYFFFFNNNSTNIGVKVKNLFENKPKEVAVENDINKNMENEENSKITEKKDDDKKIDDTNSVTETIKVKGADYLEVAGLSIENLDNGTYSVSSRIKNISKKTYKNIALRINLVDSDNKRITFLDYKINKLKPDETSSTRAALKRDLSKCANYTVEIRK